MVETSRGKFGVESSTLVLTMIFLIVLTFIFVTPVVIALALLINRIFPGYKGLLIIVSLAGFITLPMSILGGAAFYGLIERDVLGILFERWKEMSSVRRR